MSVDTLSPAALRGVWEAFVAWSGKDDAKLSIVNVQCYDTSTARAADGAATAVGPAVRTKRYHAFACAIYSDERLNDEARVFGESFRNLLTGGDAKPMLYANFAHGDESVEQLYGDGERLDKLRALKRKYDPDQVFSHFIPIY